MSPPSPSLGKLRVVVAVGLCLAVGGGILARQVEMERNFRKLRTPKVQAPISPKDALGGTNGAVVYMLASSPEALSETANDLVARHYDGIGDGEPVVFYAPSLLLPQDQAAKLPMLARMREAIDRLLKRSEGDKRERLLSLRRWVEREAPLTAENLPRAMRSALTEIDGTFGTVAVLYPPLRGSNGEQMQRLAEQTHAWHARYPEVQFASPHALLGEVLPALEEDAWMMIGLALLGLTVATALFGRSLRRTALVLLPVVVALCMTGAGMVLLDLKVNLYNTLVFPVAFGMGIDGAVYIAWGTIDSQSRRDFNAHYATAARAVIGSGLTSLFAFGSLVVAGNPGLASIGHLAVLALSMTLVTNLVWMPALLLGLRRLEVVSEPPRSAADAQ